MPTERQKIQMNIQRQADKTMNEKKKKTKNDQQTKQKST